MGGNIGRGDGGGRVSRIAASLAWGRRGRVDFSFAWGRRSGNHPDLILGHAGRASRGLVGVAGGRERWGLRRCGAVYGVSAARKRSGEQKGPKSGGRQGASIHRKNDPS